MLFSGDVDSCAKRILGLGPDGWMAYQQQLAPQPVEFCAGLPVAGLVSDLEPFNDDSQPFCRLLGDEVTEGQATMHPTGNHGPGRLVPRDRALYLGDRFVPLS